jgi:excisionase family DNA binding protein
MTANYLTTDEAAAQLRLSNKTVRRMLIDGRLPGTRVGTRWRISAQVLSEMLDGKANRDAVQRFCDENRAIVAGY